MRTLNHIYNSKKDLSVWIENEKISSKNNAVLVQIFDASLDKESISDITKTIKEYLPQAIIVGSSSSGIISDGKVYDYSTSISISEFESTSLKSFKATDSDSYETGKSMAESIIKSDTKCVFLYIDNFYYKSDDFLKGFNESGGKDVILIGSAAGDNYLFKEAFVISDTDILSNGVVAVSLSNSELECMTDYSTGWQGVGSAMRVTKSKGNCIYEINNEPILSIYERYLGKDITKSVPESMIEFPLICEIDGVEVCRSVYGASSDGGLYFATDIKEGTEVKFGIGDEATCINNIADIYVKASFKPIESIFVYSCSARKVFFGRDINQEYKALATINSQSGFIGYGEYLNVNTKNSFLNTSTVVLGISENKEVKTHLKTNIIQPSSRKKSDFALNHLIQTTTKELKEKLNDNNSLICTLQQYKRALDKTSLVSKTDVNGIITYANERFCKLSGYSQNELIGQPHSIVRHPDMSSEVFSDLWKQIKNNKIWSGMIQNRNKNGSSYYVQATVFPILDKHGNIVEYMSLREDLTSMIQHEKILETKQLQLYQILDNQDSIVVLSSESGLVKFLNRKFFDSFDFSNLDDFLSKHESLCELFLDIDGDNIGCVESKKAKYAKTNVTNKVYLTNRDQKILTYAMSTKHIAFDDSVMYLSTLTDITEIENARLLAEEAKEAKSNFLANMSHEIRTPMNGIIGFTDLLSGSELNEIQNNYVDIIKNSSAMLLDVVNGILDFSKMEHGKLLLDTTEVNIFIEMQNIYMNYSALTKQKDITYSMQLDPRMEQSLYIDKLRIKQVLSNLINNAIKFTPSGESIQVSVSIIDDDYDFQTLEFSIKDTGVGISKDRQEKIFTAFEQADGSTTREFGGTGLGLSISSSIVELMGSNITLSSQEGEGSEFSFIVSFKKCKNEASKIENVLKGCYVQVVYEKDKSDIAINYLRNFNVVTHSLSDARDYKKDTGIIILFNEEEALGLYNSLEDDRYFIICIDKDATSTKLYKNLKIITDYDSCLTTLYTTLYSYEKIEEGSINKVVFNDINILVAEDNEVNQMLIEESLKKFNIIPEIVSNGEKAVEASKNSKYNLILMDINMPVMNGIEATKSILEDSLNIETPIVAMTSNVLESDIVEYKKLGMYSHIGKPFNADDILKLLSKLFKQEVVKVIEKDTVMETEMTNKMIKETLDKAGKLLELPESIMHKLFHKFLITMKSILDDMTVHNDGKDNTNMMALSHKLKGASSSLCLDKITKIAKDMESLSKTERSVDYSMHISELSQELNILNEYFKGELDDK